MNAAGNPTPGPVLVYTRDLFFGVRIRDVVEKCGGQIANVSSLGEIASTLERPLTLAIIEMGTADQADWQEAIRQIRRSQPGVPIIAFGSHMDAAARQAARKAGCHHVWAKSRFTQALPNLIEAYLNPDNRLQGCEDPPNELVQRGLQLFNRGEYFECHELLEEAWFADRRPCRVLYQGILQLAVALYHIERGNFRGAVKMLRRAMDKFQRLPGICQGVDTATLHRQALALQRALFDVGPEGLADFPRELFPKIQASI